MVGVLILSVICQGQEFPSPPFVREWTHWVADFERIGIEGDVLYYRDGDRIAALDLQTRETLWEQPFEGEDYIGSQVITEDRIYFTTDHYEDSDDFELIAFDRSTGERLWDMPRDGDGSGIALHDGVLYTSIEPHRLSAIDLSDRSILWTTDLREDPQNENAIANIGRVTNVSAGRVFAAVRGQKKYETVSILIETGEIEWRIVGSYSFGETPFVHDGVVLLTKDRSLTAIDTQTGETLWAEDGLRPSFIGEFAGRTLIVDDDVASSVETRTGSVVWKHRSSPESPEGVISIGGSWDVYVSADLLVYKDSEGWVCLDTDGEVVWLSPSESGPGFTLTEGRGRFNSLTSPPRLDIPVWNDGDKFVNLSQFGPKWYGSGSHLPLPTTSAERSSLARLMVEQFEDLDEFEVRRLASLGDDAFEAVFEEYLKRANHFESLEFEEEFDKVISPYGDVVGEMSDVIEVMFTPSRTAALMSVIQTLPEGHVSRQTLVDIVSADGDPELSVVFFLQALKAISPDKLVLRGELSSAIEAVAKSQHPDAVDFMIELLADQTVDPSIRQLAYYNLPSTGKDKGIAAVLAERKQRTTLAPFQERINLDDLKPPTERFARQILHDEKTDAQGRIWQLFTHNFLGDDTDIWIVQKTDNGFGVPIFTGAHTFNESPRPFSQDRPESMKFYGKTAKELLDGAWLDTLVGNEEILLDSDGDGLSDLMEKRLGTDPEKADTDGDGDSDLVDPWPDTAPRELNEDEKIFAAVFEARYHFAENPTPGLFNLEGNKPFEMPGRNSWVMWSRDDDSNRLSELSNSYGRGMTSIRFHETMEFDEEYNELPRTGNTIKWNEDRTVATVTISTYFNGLAGDGTMGRVKKFGDKWVVIEMQLRYMS